MTEAERDALGNKILSTLVDLYADQMGVKVEYQIVKKGEDHGNHHGNSAGAGVHNPGSAA